MRLFPLIILLVQASHITARLVLVDDQNGKVAVPTFDFFEYRSNPYNVTGIACRVGLVRDPKTKLCKVVEPLAFNKTNFTQTFSETILFTVFAEARACGITTISQLFDKNNEMQPLLARAGYPPSKTLAIFMDTAYDGDDGCPLEEPYIAPRFNIPDAPPPRRINVALVARPHTVKLLDVLDGTAPFAFNAVQDTDPWNAVYLSLGYAIFNWTKISIYTISIVVALGIVLKDYRKKAVEMSLRNMIFWIAFLAAITYAVSSPMRRYNYLRNQLKILCEFLSATAFFTLLYLWSILVMRIRPGIIIYVLRVLIILGFLMSTTVIMNRCLRANQLPIPYVADFIDKLFRYVVVPYQCVMAIISIVFAIIFYRGKDFGKAPPEILSALKKLSLLAFVGFVFFVVTFSGYFLLVNGDACKVGVHLSRAIMKETTFLLWTTTLLFILRVKTE